MAFKVSTDADVSNDEKGINTVRYISNELIRGQRPDTHADLVFLGCVAVVDLQSGVHELLHSDKYESESPPNFGLNGYSIRCSDIFPPSERKVELFLRIVADYRLTYVHCLHGKDRTGFMVAAYRMSVEGWSYKDAVKEMFDHGFHKWPYIWWVPFLHRYSKKQKTTRVKMND